MSSFEEDHAPEMTASALQRLREAAIAAMKDSARAATWVLQTSNSYRRIGTSRGDGDVLCATTQPIDPRGLGALRAFLQEAETRLQSTLAEALPR